MFEPQTAINNYNVDWASLGARPDLAQSISYLFDAAFSWGDDLGASSYVSIENQRAEMLRVSPELDIRNRIDGFDLDAEKMLAIQQKNSRGFNIVDVNPGLLTSLDYPLSLPYEFLFDGTNFMPDIDDSITRNFRTVNIPIAGNYVKVEYINEVNNTSNLARKTSIDPAPVTSRSLPHANRKYEDFIPNEADLSTGREDYSMDNYARTKVFINFSGVTEKPLMVTRSGDAFHTFFTELNITLNIGAPKIRVTIGMNSTKEDGQGVGDINSKLALAGGARLLADIDTTLSPFSICENDNFTTTWSNRGALIANVLNYNTNTQLIANYNSAQTFQTYLVGYSVLWITRIYFSIKCYQNSNVNFMNTVRLNLSVTNPIQTELKRIHQGLLNISSSQSIGGATATGENTYVFEPNEPIRVIIPATCTLNLFLNFNGSALMDYEMSYSIDGYSLGEILSYPVVLLPGAYYLATSKFITDATYLADFNRVKQISRYN